MPHLQVFKLSADAEHGCDLMCFLFPTYSLVSAEIGAVELSETAG